MPVRLLLLSCVAALALAGCGVKGPLEPPKADTAAPAAQSSAGQTPAGSPSASSPMATTPMTNADAARDAGDQAWGANPVSVGGINPPDMPGNSVSMPAPAASAAKKGFFLDFLL
ncbi:MAG: lipoprotein [Pseudomonadota bacterium]